MCRSIQADSPLMVRRFAMISIRNPNSDSSKEPGSIRLAPYMREIADAMDDCIGFTLARDFDPREIGLLYYVMASSQTLGDAGLRDTARLRTRPSCSDIERETGSLSV
jgi:hypothetical protein